MREYDPNEPLIVIHVPKAAGVSSREFFQTWYGKGFLTHYPNERKGKLPKKYDLFGKHSSNRPVVLHGHFNKLRKFGVEDYYPDVNQFITILRDPLELTISNYFYLRKIGASLKDKTHIPVDNIEKYLLNTKPNMLNHFPREVTKENYKDIIEEYFIEIGITEHLRDSMKWIACKLDKNFDEKLLGHHNATDRDQDVPEYLRELFIEKNPLEFEVYNYALEKFVKQGVPPADNTT